MAIYKTRYCKTCGINYPYAISQGKDKVAYGECPKCKKGFKLEIVDTKNLKKKSICVTIKK